MDSLSEVPLIADREFQQRSRMSVRRYVEAERVRVEETVARQSGLVTDQCVPLAERQYRSIANR